MRRGRSHSEPAGPVAAGAPERSKGGPGGGPPFACRGKTCGFPPTQRTLWPFAVAPGRAKPALRGVLEVDLKS
jgi:hypothetical protein